VLALRFASCRLFFVACFLSALTACTGSSLDTVPGPTQTPAAQTALYAYSPDGPGALLAYPASARGRTPPTSILAGPKTTFVGGKANLFGGGISIAADGTTYVFDAMRARVLTFAAGSRGDVAPSHVERLPPNDNVRLKAPQYAGFALDGLGNFWTVDRSNGNIDRFRIGGDGDVMPGLTFKPSVLAWTKFVPGVASTVASDEAGNIYCICQPDDLILQLYCITQYDVTHGDPKLVRSFYGILGNLDTQIPSTVLHVDPHTKKVYVGIWTPAAVVEYPSDAPSGPAPRPNVIGGTLTTLDSVPAAITTDARGRVFVAQRSAVAVFSAGASGNVRPARVLSDPQHLRFLGQAYGDLLQIR